MEVTNECLHGNKTLLEEESQNKCETVINNNMLNVKVNMSENCLHMPDVIDLEEKGLYNLQRDDQNKSKELGESDAYIGTNNETLNEESLYENIEITTQLKSTPKTKKASETKNIHASLNVSAISGNSSSEEEILQTRLSVQNKSYENEYNSPKSSASFVSNSDNESIEENYSDVKKRPIIIQAKVYNKKNYNEGKTNNSNFETEQTKKNKHQEAAADIASYNSLSVEVDDSNIDTESSYLQNSIKNKNKDLYLKRKDASAVFTQNIMKNAMNETTFNQNIEETNDISSDSIIQDFLNGTLNVSAFIPEKKLAMIKSEKVVTKNNQLVKDKHSPRNEQKYRRNVQKNSNYSKKIYSLFNDNNKAQLKKINDDSMVHLKRKLSRTETENRKKSKVITGENKVEAADITSDKLNKCTFKPNTGSEKKDLKPNSKQVKNQSQYNHKSITALNSFEIKEENSKKIKTRNNTKRTKRNTEKIFKDFSYKITPLKKQRANLRNSSLIASKKIKEIEQLENADGYDEICLDSDISYCDSNIEKTEDNYKSTFKSGKINQNFKTEFKLDKDKFCNEDIISIASSGSFQLSSKKEKEIKNKRTTRGPRKCKSKFEGILDACHFTSKPQLKRDNKETPTKYFTSETNQLNILVEESEDTYENHHNNRKKISNRRQSENNDKTENKLVKYSKNIDKTRSCKNETIGKTNYGPITRSKTKTWDMLEKELLGESNDVTKIVQLKERSDRKQNMKDADLYSISNKSVMQTIRMPAKGNKCVGKYKIQNIESECLQTPANAQRDSNKFLEKIQSNAIVPYKSKNIVEKTIAAMEKCTAKFIAPKVNFTEKKWIHSGLEFDDMSIDQEAEFHSNMTFVTNKNEQYYKNEIVAVLKLPNSKKGTNSSRQSTTSTVYNGGEYKYDFDNAEHLVKKSFITQSYSVKNNAAENQKIKSQALISISEKKEVDPWTRLIKELNLEQNNENMDEENLNGKPYRKSLAYHENLKQHTNTYSNISKEKFKEDETANEESEVEVSKQATFEETSVLPNCIDSNVEDKCVINYTKSKRNNKNAESGNEYTTEKMEKTAKTVETKRRQAVQMKKVKRSPKFKLEVEDGGVKFKRCVRSLSSSSEESEKRKRRNINYDDKKIPKNENKLEKEKYKKYLNNLFEEESLLSKEKSKNNGKTQSMKEDSSFKKKFKEQRKMVHTLIAKNEDDVFSISSSDSETENKKNPGSGLLCDFFDK